MCSSDLADAVAVDPAAPTDGGLQAQSDKQKIAEGLGAFADWADGLSAKISAGFNLPFVPAKLSDLWNSGAGVIAGSVGTKIRDQIVTAISKAPYPDAGTITSVPGVTRAPRGGLTDFVADVTISSTSRDQVMSLDLLKDIGLDLTSFANFTMSTPLHLEAGLHLKFGFGLDVGSGGFYVQDPSLVATVTVGSLAPFDASLTVGPLGIGIDQGTVYLKAGVVVPAVGRVGTGHFGDLDVRTPRFDTTSTFTVNLPFVLEGALAGIGDGTVGTLRGSFNTPNSPARNVDKLTAASFFTQIVPNNLNFDGANFGALQDLKNVSLDAALEGLKTALTSAIAPDGAAYRKLPFVDKSAVDLLGDGSTDVVQSIINAISSVQSNLSDINRFEIELNAKLNEVLSLGLPMGDKAAIRAAYDRLVAVSRSLSSSSSDSDLAVALARKTAAADFAGLVADRDVVAAADRLAQKGLSGGSSDTAVALAVADGATFTARASDRALVAANTAFTAAWSRLRGLGLDEASSDSDIAAVYDTSSSVVQARADRDAVAAAAAGLRADALALAARGLGATPDGVAFAAAVVGLSNEGADALRAARSRLAAAPDFAAAWNRLRANGFDAATTDAAISAYFDRSATIQEVEADRDLVAGFADLVAAARRLAALGLDQSATDLSLATAIAGQEALAPWFADRTLVGTADVAAARARLAGRQLGPTSSDDAIARAVVAPAALAALAADRDTVATYDAAKSVDLAYKDSVLRFDLRLAKNVVGDYDLKFDLGSLPGVGDLLTGGDLALALKSDGKLHVDAGLNLDLGFTFDLSRLGSPKMLVSDSSRVTFDHLSIKTLAPVNVTGSVLVGGKPVLSLAMRNATIDADLSGTVSLVADSTDHRYEVGELAADKSLWNVDLVGRLAANLPLYFPTASQPLGGTDADRNLDGVADNALDVSGTFRGANDYDLRVVAPRVSLLSVARDVFAVLNDPAVMLQGLDGMFSGIRDGLGSQFAALALPMIGDKLKDAAGFVDTLRDRLLGVAAGMRSLDVTNSARYEAGSIGRRLADAVRLNSDSDPANDLLVSDLMLGGIRQALYEKLGAPGLDVLKVPLLDTDGRPVFDTATGAPRLVRVTSADQVEIGISDGALVFNVTLGDSLLKWMFSAGTDVLQWHDKDPGAGEDIVASIPIDFAAAIPGFSVSTGPNDTIDLRFNYAFGLGIGLGATDGIFLDTAGVTQSGSEVQLDLSATVSAGASLQANVIFLQGTLKDVLDGRPSGFYGQFSVDVQSSGGDRWRPMRGDALSVVTRLSAVADMDVDATLALTAPGGSRVDFQLPTVYATIHYDQTFADVTLGGGVSKAEFGGAPLIVFENVRLDVGEFISGFMGPIINQVHKVTAPIEPLAKILTKEIPLLKQLGAKQTSLLDIAGTLLGSSKFASVVKAVKAITDLVQLVDTISDFTDNKPGEPIIVSFGTFVMGNDPRSKNSPGAVPADTPTTAALPTTNAKANAVTGKIGTKPGSFQFPLLSNPAAAFGLLTGQDVSLFEYDLPALDLQFLYEQAFPIFPGLMAKLGGEVRATTNFTFGLTTRGFFQFQAGGYRPEDIPLIFTKGFYVSDHGIQGSGNDQPEATLTSRIFAGAAVGIGGLVEAGVEGSIQATVNFDLNDKPNPGTGIYTNNDPRRGYAIAPQYDGRIYLDELLDRLDHGPQCIFDVYGQLVAGLDAYFWVGVKIFGSKITVFEARKSLFRGVIADFNFHCDDEPPPTLATLDKNTGRLELLLAPQTEDGKTTGDTYDISQEDLDDGNGGRTTFIKVSARGFSNYFQIGRAHV